MENLTNKTTNWCVYMHEHRETGKKYIGITSQKPTRRWRNGEVYVDNPRFYPDIQRSGWDAFHHEILFTDLTQEEAELLEVELIAKYQTQDPTKGYNIASGGGVRLHTEETREKLRRTHKGQMPTELNKERRMASVKGKPQTEEHRRKLSISRGGRRIRCVETGAVYVSAYEVQRETGIDARSVRQVCKHEPQHITAGGFHWEYVDEAVVGRD